MKTQLWVLNHKCLQGAIQTLLVLMAHELAQAGTAPKPVVVRVLLCIAGKRQSFYQGHVHRTGTSLLPQSEHGMVG